jgi:hypothetical protein
MLTAALLLSLHGPSARAGEGADLLVLAADASYSIDAAKFDLR